MAFKPTTTRANARANGLKVLVYGPAGAGKTVLCSTTGCPEATVIISCESGLLSLRNAPEMRVADVKTIEGLGEAYEYVRTAGDVQWVCLDSISEIAEVCLSEEKARNKDPRAAYGVLGDKMTGLLRAFRELPMNVYFSAKQKDDETRSRASMPGNALTQGLPYIFDEVFALRIQKDEAGKPVRMLQTAADGSYDAKDRSGSLSMWEPPSLAHVYGKIMGGE